MLASNQPYRRVDDGIGAGLVGGAVMGGALSAGAIYGGTKGIDQLSKLDASMFKKASDKFSGLDSPTEKQSAKMDKKRNRAAGRAAAYGVGMDHAQSLGGMSGKRKAMAIAGSSVLGSLLGGAGDGLSK